MNIIKENTARKIDSSGRIIIPKSLRDRFNISLDDELEFFTLEDNAGIKYIAMSKIDGFADPRYEIASQVLTELGFEVPDAILEKIK